MASHNWLAIRTFYFSSSTVSYRQCAEKFGVSTRSIETRASKEGWVEERGRMFGAASDKLRELGQIDATSSLFKHTIMSAAMVDLIVESIPEVKTMKPGRSKAETIKVLADAMDKVGRFDRIARGIDDGEASAPDDKADDGNGVRIIRTIVPAPVALNA
jgi:uncharacterized protein YjcR